jgi:predicted transcriptional regulator
MNDTSCRTDDAVVSKWEHASVADAMHRGVISCAGESSAWAAARAMAAHRIHCVVVKGGEGIPRLITDMDVAAAMFDEQLGTLSAEALSQPAPLLHPDDTLALALQLMREHRTSHVVVVGSSLNLLGVVSVLDLVECSVERRNPISEPPDDHPGP